MRKIGDGSHGGEKAEQPQPEQNESGVSFPQEERYPGAGNPFQANSVGGNGSVPATAGTTGGMWNETNAFRFALCDDAGRTCGVQRDRGPASRQESSAASQEESVGSQVSVESSGETAPETPWRYTAENPKEWDLAAALANFTRQLSLEELLASLPNSTIPEAPEGAIMKQVYSEGWSFLGTEGVLSATYQDDPEGEGILLSTLDYWALNYKLQTYAKILDGINAMKLPGVENYEQLPLALTDIFLNEQGGYLPIEEYSEPYLPTNANTYGATLLADGAGEKAYAIECIFWSGDKAEKFCPNPLKKDAPEVLSGIMIRLSYTTDVGV